MTSQKAQSFFSWHMNNKVAFINIPYGQSSVKLPVIWASDHPVNWSSRHPIITSFGHLVSGPPIIMSFKHFISRTDLQTNNIRIFRYALQTNTCKVSSFSLSHSRRVQMQCFLYTVFSLNHTFNTVHLDMQIGRN